MHTVQVPNLGTLFTFTNVSQKSISSNQNNVPKTDTGKTFSLYENKLRPYHFGLVADGVVTVIPNLPPDLVTRARSMNWQDTEWRNLLATLTASITKLEFSDDSVIVGTVNTPVDIYLQSENTDGVPIYIDSATEIDITSVGTNSKIVAVTGYVSGTLNGLGPIRAKMSSGKIKITLVKTSAGAQTISLSNPSPAGLTVTDTHVVTWS